MNETELSFSTAGDLFQHWANAGYPDYVTGVWSTDGSYYTLTIGVLENEAGEIGKQEILDLITDDTTVTFVYQTYSRNYLLRLQEELLPYFKQEELGMVSIGLSDTENHIEIGILEEKRNDEASLNFIAELRDTYGDAVSVIYTDSTIELTTEEIGLSAPLSPTTSGSIAFPALWTIGLIGIPLLVFGMYFVLKKRFVPVLQTTAGNSVTKTKKLSTRDVESLIKECSLPVSNDLDEKILKDIACRGKDTKRDT